MNDKQRASEIIKALKKKYPEAICSLRADTPFELLVSTRLSAQCTDKRVNEITPALFNRYKTIKDYAGADISEVENYVRPCGFYHTKARDIVNMAKMLEDKYGGVIPDNIEQLLKLPGVGRKTANLIVGDLYNKPAVVCDTHVIRVSNRLKLVNTTNPEKIEAQLKRILPPKESNDFCHRIVLHGRETCTARKAFCGKCILLQYCSYGKAQNKND